MRMSEGQDKLIEAVKKRPLLYSRYHPQFTDRKLKQDLWYEVCADVVHNWTNMNCGQKGEMVQEIRRRWKTLRDGFSRELVFQRQDRMKRAKGEVVRRRKIYGHFNELKFLLKQKKKPANIDLDVQGDEGNENSDSDGTEASNTRESGESRDNESVTHSFKIEPGTSSFYVDVGNMQDSKGFEGQNNIPEFEAQNNTPGAEVEKTVEDDEDKLFCLSLVPSFKKMTEKQKYDARIRVMQVLSEVRFKNGDSLDV